MTAELCAKDLVPPAVLRRVTDLSTFLDALARYVAMDDDDLLRATEVCLRNLERLDDLTAGPDSDLRLVLMPEFWERIRTGTRDNLRRISSTLAEYKPDPARPSIFARLLSPERMARLSEGADDLRARVARVSRLDVGALVEQVRFAIAGSRAGDRWSPADCVYEPGFTYRLVPAVAWRAIVRGRTAAIRSGNETSLAISSRYLLKSEEHESQIRPTPDSHDPA